MGSESGGLRVGQECGGAQCGSRGLGGRTVLEGGAVVVLLQEQGSRSVQGSSGV